MTSDKKIGIIIGCLNLGGAEKTAALLSRQLSNNGYDVYIFIDRHSGGTAFKYLGKIVWMSSIETGDFERNLKYRAYYLENLKREIGIDVSISFMEPYNFMNMMSDIGDKKLVSVRTFLSSRRQEQPKLDNIYKKKIPKLYNKASYVVTMTEAQEEDLVTNYVVNRDKVAIIPNTIDENNNVNDDNCSPEIKLSRHSIVNIGRLIDVKAQWQLIRAMQKVLDIVPDVQVYFLGSGENLTMLTNLAESLDVSEHIHFEGFSSDVGFYLKQADILVHVSRAEGFVNALLDAFANGTPVICTDVKSSPRELLAPGTRQKDIFTEPEYAEYGVLVPAPDIDKKNFSKELTTGENILADAIIRILTDDEIREHYQKKSKERAMDFTADKITAKWINLIEA